MHSAGMCTTVSRKTSEEDFQESGVPSFSHASPRIELRLSDLAAWTFTH